MTAAKATPARVSFTNIATGETLEAQLNPKQFSASVSANYASLQPPGAGYEPLQYTGTGNPSFPVELLFVVRSQDEIARLDEARRFFLALLYPRRGQVWMRQAAPPRVLYLWPNVASVVCVVRNFSLMQQRAFIDCSSAEEVMTLQLEETRDGQMFSEDVRVQGFLRPSPRVVGGQGTEQ